MEIGAQAGCGYYVGDATQHIFQNVREAYGLHFRYKFTPRWAVVANGMQHTIVGPIPNKTDLWKNHMLNMDATAEFNFFRFGEKQYDKRYQPITPYIFAGIGMSVYGKNWSLNTLGGYVPLGFGLKWKFSDHCGLNLKWQHNIYFSDNLEGRGEWNNLYGLNGSNWFNCDVTSQLTLGLVVEFGKVKQICKTCEL